MTLDVAKQAAELAEAFPQKLTEQERDDLVEAVKAGDYRMTGKPEHYNQHPSGIECQEIIRECKDPMVAFAMKHLWRTQWGNKPGAPKTLDLKKAIEYLQLELAREQGRVRL